MEKGRGRSLSSGQEKSYLTKDLEEAGEQTVKPAGQVMEARGPHAQRTEEEERLPKFKVYLGGTP